MAYDDWKAHNPDDESLGPEPCDFETFSGECLYCGARLGQECGYERDQINDARGGFDNYALGYYVSSRR